MQTFLPYPDFEESARVLDPKRLGKQRVEAYQIIKALSDPEYGWQNHPAVKMWRGFTPALGIYMDAMINEWIRRGYRNTMKLSGVTSWSAPEWVFDERVHLSHRSNLVRKDPDYYGMFWPDVPSDLPYLWPERENKI